MVQALRDAGLPAFREGEEDGQDQSGAVVRTEPDAETGSASVSVGWRASGMTDFIRTGRLFRVVGFNPSHRQLFLQSEATLIDGTSTHIEVHVGHVRLMLLQPYYRNGLHIRRASPEEFAVLAERHGLEPDEAAYTWMLDPDGDSFVVGSPPDWREAEYALMGDRESLYAGPWPPDFPADSGNLF